MPPITCQTGPAHEPKPVEDREVPIENLDAQPFRHHADRELFAEGYRQAALLEMT